MKVRFAARSHPGRVRLSNEDNFYCNGATLTPGNRDAPFALNGSANVPCVFAVCDGMGGEEDGEFASLTAVTALAEHAKEIKSAAAAGTEKIHAAVRTFVTDANSRLCDAMRVRSLRMGTTLALVVITDDAVYPYNLGDSRIYALQSRRFTRVSEDHTLAAQKVEMGILTEAEARRDRGWHVLTRCLGIFQDEMTVEPASAEPLPLGEGCRVLLCSDGLTDMVTDVRIAEILRGAPVTEKAAERLVTEALENGGRDNVTCVAVDVMT
ncbi:MAG: protein phosphatase 2C domain-containing protein [Synergistaceae bacterium]|jgi:protein phosphatase|nr:protein phosphatase 2C domain-containing protein [Synergistaceae bacterium]